MTKKNSGGKRTRFSAHVAARALSRALKSTRSFTRETVSDIGQVIRAVARVGSKRLLEFALALPVFVAFVRELVRERDKFSNRNRLLIVGAGATLSLLLGGIVFTLLTSFMFQLAVLLANPLLGVALILNETAIALAAVVALVWLVMYVLNSALMSEEEYATIRDSILPRSAQDIYEDVTQSVRDDVEGLGALRELLEDEMVQRATEADAEQIAKKLRDQERTILRRIRKKLERLDRRPVEDDDTPPEPAA